MNLTVEEQGLIFAVFHSAMEHERELRDRLKAEELRKKLLHGVGN